MAKTANPLFELNAGERMMLKAYLMGTQTVTQYEEDPLWTKEAIKGIKEILNGDYSNFNPTLAQHIFCSLADITGMEATRTDADKDLTQCMIKFMHHITEKLNWTVEHLPKEKPGPKAKSTSAPNPEATIPTKVAATAQPNSGQSQVNT